MIHPQRAVQITNAISSQNTHVPKESNYVEAKKKYKENNSRSKAKKWKWSSRWQRKMNGEDSWPSVGSVFPWMQIGFDHRMQRMMRDISSLHLQSILPLPRTGMRASNQPPSFPESHSLSRSLSISLSLSPVKLGKSGYLIFNTLYSHAQVKLAGTISQEESKATEKLSVSITVFS